MADDSNTQQVTPLLQAFLFADIRGYSGYVNQHGIEAAHDLVRPFFALITSVIRERGGRVESYGGDGLFAIFSSLGQAIRAGVEMQLRAGEAHEKMPGFGVGISSGDALRSEWGLQSDAVNLAARLCSKAQASEVRVDAATAERAGTLPGLVFSERRRDNELKGFEIQDYVLVTSGEQAPGATAAAPTLVGVGDDRSLLENLPASAPRSFLARALETAWAEVPESARVPGMYRWMGAWQGEQAQVPVPLTTIKDAVSQTARGEASVFALLRYYDYARWEANSLSWGFRSEQRDAHQPLHVSWEVSRFGTVFQHSAQPEFAGTELAVNYTAWYCARAVDLVGVFFRQLKVDSPVTLLIGLSGTRLRSLVARFLEGDQSLYEPLDAWWWQTQTVDDWIDRRIETAITYATDLLLQAGVSGEQLNEVPDFVEAEIASLDDNRSKG